MYFGTIDHGGMTRFGASGRWDVYIENPTGDTFVWLAINPFAADKNSGGWRKVGIADSAMQAWQDAQRETGVTNATEGEVRT